MGDTETTQESTARHKYKGKQQRKWAREFAAATPRQVALNIGGKSVSVPNWRYGTYVGNLGAAYMKPKETYSETTMTQPFNWMDALGAGLSVAGSMMPFGGGGPNLIPYQPLVSPAVGSGGAYDAAMGIAGLRPGPSIPPWVFGG